MAGTLPFVTLDVFTTTRYIGNPVAIVRVPRTTTINQSQKQRIAREFNLSETVFLHEQTKADKSDSLVRIDIFTTLAEVPFAGHPTVGTANYLLRLLDAGGNDEDAAAAANASSPIPSIQDIKALQTKAGRLELTLNPSVNGVQISVAHNVRVHASPFADRPFGSYPVVSIVRGMTFILARLESLEELAAVSANLLGPNSTYSAKAALDDGWREGLVASYFYVDLGYVDGGEGQGSAATSAGEGKVRDIRTRMFGSREDPATGSAASALTSYLSLEEARAGRYRYRITQGVEMGRKSEIFIEVGTKDQRGTGKNGVEIDEVLLSGSAVLNLQGTLIVPDEE